MSYSKEYLKLIKATVPLSWIVSSWVVLTPSGGQREIYRGLCPFHQEKTGSFRVYERSGRFHCYGCGERGDVFDFLIRLDDWKTPRTLAGAVEYIVKRRLLVERHGKFYVEDLPEVYPKYPRKRKR